MKEADRQRTIRQKLARFEGRFTAPPLPTGLARLDAALSGGLPRGAIVEIFGPAASGKTTLALQIAASVQKGGGGVSWIDAEHTMDPAYAAGLAIDLERFPILRPESSEQALEIARRLAESCAIDLLVVDSAAALVPAVELEAGIGDPSPGLHSRVLAMGLRRLRFAAVRSGTTVLFVNQTRMRLDEAGIPYETAAGGAPLKLHASVRVALLGVEAHGLRFRVLKNKAAGVLTEGILLPDTDAGFTKTP